MVRQAGRRIREEMRERLWAAGRMPRRIRERLPPQGPSPRIDDLRASGLRPGLAAWAVAGAILAVAGVLIYFRKRRQVAAHFKMGDGAAWEGGTPEAFRSPVTARS